MSAFSERVTPEPDQDLPDLCSNSLQQEPFEHLVADGEAAAFHGFMTPNKIKSEAHLLKAARHNFRQIKAELQPGGRIDAARSHLNQSLLMPATPQEVVALFRQIMTEDGLRQRRSTSGLAQSGTIVVEVLFSLSNREKVDRNKYFEGCVDFCGRVFCGHENLLSANIHRDEGAQHLHVLFVPVQPKPSKARPDAKGLAASRIFGDKVQLKGLREKFFLEVAQPLGIKKSKKMREADKQQLAAKVIGHMKAHYAPALQDPAWPVFFDCINEEPQKFADWLGIAADVPQTTPARSMTAIFISPGKGAKTHAEEARRLAG